MLANDSMEGEPKRVRRPRPKKPKSQLTQFERRSLALTPDQWEGLEMEAMAMNVLSRAGPKFGTPSWRTMISRVADDAPAIISHELSTRGDDIDPEIRKVLQEYLDRCKERMQH